MIFQEVVLLLFCFYYPMVFRQGSGCQRVFKDIPGSVMMVSRGVPAVFRGCSGGVAGMFRGVPAH